MDWRLRRYQTLFATQIRLGETCMVLRNWISILIPKAEDGNNFGVEVQEQCLVKLVGKALLRIEHVLKLKFRGRERNADGSWADGGVSPWTIANSRKVDYLPRYSRLLVSLPTLALIWLLYSDNTSMMPTKDSAENCRILHIHSDRAIILYTEHWQTTMIRLLRREESTTIVCTCTR